MYELVLGVIISFVIAFIAYKKTSLTLSGAVAAIFLGAFLYLSGGLLFSVIIVSFFISSSILSKFKKYVKAKIGEINEKSDNRDYTQVIANGGVGLICAILYYMTKEPLYSFCYAVSVAASNSDTWASELGILSKRDPVSIITWKPVRKGMSGGISVLGIIVSLFGSGFIAAIYSMGLLLMDGFRIEVVFIFVLCTAGGFLGSIIDSIIGATLQAKYYSEKYKIITEKKFIYGSKNRLVSGFSIVNNNIVNFTSSLISTIAAGLAYIFLIPLLFNVL